MGFFQKQLVDAAGAAAVRLEKLLIFVAVFLTTLAVVSLFSGVAWFFLLEVACLGIHALGFVSAYYRHKALLIVFCVCHGIAMLAVFGIPLYGTILYFVAFATQYSQYYGDSYGIAVLFLVLCIILLIVYCVLYFFQLYALIFAIRLLKILFNPQTNTPLPQTQQQWVNLTNMPPQPIQADVPPMYVQPYPVAGMDQIAPMLAMPQGGAIFTGGAAQPMMMAVPQPGGGYVMMPMMPQPQMQVVQQPLLETPHIV
eukprot:TRINITY_DN18010_c0_g1_i1.p2 TRINITY_DN18010_c0_g1~~TRINITY_DN18010_c0_g1_i1.p2  ORF type:complete len:255 (-),score=61.44 TRINITY_DN18010_c0_g1_i1:75-839(-)